jgi:NAD(P)-dependent dehydrogenase (short-subunit alcohol dehydrogenase family)
MRLEGKTAIVVGAGQTPGGTIGNGRAIALLFAREGAQVLCIDRDGARAEETAGLIAAEGGRAEALAADIAKPGAADAIVDAAKARLGGLAILINNVGIGGGGDAPAHKLEEAAYDRVMTVNLKAMWLTIKAAVPAMREAGGGAIVNVSSLASIAGGNMLAYEISKAGVNRLTLHVAQSNAKYGIRCNAVLPGLMDTPMAMAATVRGQSEEALRQLRDSRVPLGAKMGTGWDTAYAALYLASDEAKFVTGVLLPVDGGMSSRIG